MPDSVYDALEEVEVILVLIGIILSHLKLDLAFAFQISKNKLWHDKPILALPICGQICILSEL